MVFLTFFFSFFFIAHHLPAKRIQLDKSTNLTRQTGT